MLYHGLGIVTATGGQPLRLRDGRYECTLCGAVLDVSSDKAPFVMIKAATGGTTMRAILLEGIEIHACVISTREVQQESDRPKMLIAQGMVAEQTACSLSDALVLMQTRAEDEGRTIGDIAADVVERRAWLP